MGDRGYYYICSKKFVNFIDKRELIFIVVRVLFEIKLFLVIFFFFENVVVILLN